MQRSNRCGGGLLNETDLCFEAETICPPDKGEKRREKRKHNMMETIKDLEGIFISNYNLKHAVFSCSALCSFSGPRLHQQCLPRSCASDIVGGGISSESVLAAQWSVWATTCLFQVISAGPVLAWTHPYAPAVPREAWGWRVSLHGVRTLWGSLVRVCPTIQRLPVCLPGRLGGTPEFLWLPFGLRKCFVLALLSPTSLLSTGILTPVLALWDSYNVVAWQ